MKILKSLIFLFLTVFLSQAVPGQTIPDKKTWPALVHVSQARLDRIDRIIQENIDQGRIAGAVGFIARDGKVVYHKAFGYSDIKRKTPMHTDDIFRIASQTKAITSVAIMMLFEEGRLLLDDPVSKYIPSFANPVVLDKFNPSDTTYTTVPAKREITLRDLLTHTSGIDYAVIGTPNMKAIYAKAGIPVGFEGGDLILEQEINKLGKLPLAHQPGERFTYGLNSDVLGSVVERVSGKSLDVFFRERIFEPLGMRDTYFFLPASKQSRLVPIYTYNDKNVLIPLERYGVITADYPERKGTYFSGGAGLSSTISDYAAFLQMLLNKGVYNGKRLLARRTVELMTSNQIGDLNVRADKFGLGFQITTRQGQAKLGMSEGSFSWGGYFGTTYWADPKEKLVCLLFTQQSPLKSDLQDKFKASVYQALND